VRRKKGDQWNVASMVCAKTTDAHLKEVAAAAFRSATVAADEAQAQVARRQDALRSDVARAARCGSWSDNGSSNDGAIGSERSSRNGS